MPSNSKFASYTLLPASSAGEYPVLPNYIIVYRHILHPPNFHPILRRCISFSLSLFLFSLFLFLLWPSDPEVKVLRVELNNVSVRTSPSLSLDLSLFVVARVRNRDFFSLDYDSLRISIGYRGRKLGYVRADGGHLKASASTDVNSTIVIDGFQVLHDFIYFIEDVARGSVPFDTDTTMKGELGILSLFKIPIQAKVSCEVNVNPQKQTIVRQNCYPE